MTGLAYRHPPLTAADAAIAKAASKELAHFARTKRPLKLRVREAGQDHPIELPAGAVALLLDVLGAMASGRGVTLIPENAELTTVEAAEILNVSRPFLIKLLEEGAIPHRKVGRHRRIRIEDLMDYKRRDDKAREAVLDELVREAQEQDLGYRKP
jgi:excisionase family DNA binding protein